MNKPQTKVSSEKVEVDGKLVTRWTKVCPYCHKTYTTFSRSQKFCSDSCCKKYNKKQKESRARYSRVKDVERIRVRSHALGVAVMDQLAEMGIVEKKCSCCGATENLELHHIDHFNWLNNTPSNLRWLCKKCHAEEHSRVEAELNEQGILLTEWYEPSMEKFYEVLNVNSKK